jgi:predicted PurR-regulated permease PerM
VPVPPDEDNPPAADDDAKPSDVVASPKPDDAPPHADPAVAKLQEQAKQETQKSAAPVAPKWVVPLVGVLAVGAILHFGKPILLPLTLATLISFLLAPLCEWLERKKLPRVLATALVVGLAVCIMAGIGYALYRGLNQLANNREAYTQRVVDKVNTVFGGGGDDMIEGLQDTADKLQEAVTGTPVEKVNEPTTRPATRPVEAAVEPDGVLGLARLLSSDLRERDAVVVAAIDGLADRLELAIQSAFDEPIPVQEPSSQSPIAFAGTLLLYAAGPAGLAGLVAVFVLFILLQRDDLRDRLIKLAAGGKINLATQAIDDAARRITRFLRAQAIVNGTYGLAIGCGLLGISYAIAGEWFPGVILWATLCAILRFIPYLGPWLAAAFPVLVSLGHYDGYGVFLAIVAMFLVVELFSNNVMEPMLYGTAIGMSDFAVVIAATVWAFLWGPVGLLVAMPLTTCLVVLGKYVPQLGFFDTLLGDEPVLSPHSRLYQRLLAMDADDAVGVAEEFRADHSLSATFDDLVLPALALAERDREAGNLSEERTNFIRRTMHDLVQTLGGQEEPIGSDSVDLTDPAPLGTSPAAQRLAAARVVLLPASDEADTTAAEMLKVLLDRRGFTVTVVGEEALTSEKLEAVAGGRADVVLVSALPPRATARARYLIKKLDASGFRPQSDHEVATAVVGLWTSRLDPRQAERRVCGSASEQEQRRVRVVTRLADAVEQVRQRAEVAISKSGNGTAAT